MICDRLNTHLPFRTCSASRAIRAYFPLPTIPLLFVRLDARRENVIGEVALQQRWDGVADVISVMQITFS